LSAKRRRAHEAGAPAKCSGPITSSARTDYIGISGTRLAENIGPSGTRFRENETTLCETEPITSARNHIN
jgi:hypothetical protein